jgi:hypothetical protein
MEAHPPRRDDMQGMEKEVFIEGLSRSELKTLRVLFDAIDVEGNGTIEMSEFAQKLEQVGETSIFIKIEEHLPAHEPMSFEAFAKTMTQAKKRSWVGKVALALLLGCCPALYSASTRLPFIFLGIEVLRERDGSFAEVGLLLGMYQTCRALANFTIMNLSTQDPFRKIYCAQATFGLSGWLLSALLPHHGLVWPLFLLCLVGLSEAIVTLQVAALRETQHDSPTGSANEKVQAARLRSQYTSVSLGSAIAYIAGGYIYANYGFVSICWFGVVLNILSLLAGSIYHFIGASDASACSFGGDSGGNKKQELMPTIGSTDLLKRLAYMCCTSSALLETVRGQGPSNEALLAVRPIVARDLQLQGAIHRLFSNLKKRHGGKFGESALLELFSFDKTSLKKNDDIEGWRDVHTALYMMTHSGDADVVEDEEIREDELVEFLLPRVFLKLHPKAAAKTGRVYPYLAVVVMTQAVMALCIGTFLSTALLYYDFVFGYNSETTGLLLGVGEVMGVLIMLGSKLGDSTGKKLRPRRYSTAMQLIQSQKQFEREISSKVTPTNIFAIMAQRPLRVPVVLITVALATVCFTIPVAGAAIFCQQLMSGFNDFSVSLINELTAASTPASKFKQQQAFGQSLRRLGNCLTALTGPLLFGINPALPFLLYGGVVFAWVIVVLWPSFYLHACHITPGLSKGAFPPITVFRHFTHLKPWHVFEAEFEHMHQVSKTGHVKSMEFTIARLSTAVKRLRSKVSGLEEQVGLLKIK